MNFGLLKHSGPFRWLVTLGICAAIQLPASHGTPVSAAELPTGATLTILADPVQVASGADATFLDAFAGQSLQAGDVVRTGPSGMALLTFFDGSESQLSSSSQVQIEQADYWPAPQIALLQTDGVTVNRVIPLPPGGNFRTDTPEATGLVRGTSYVVSIGSDDNGASATSMVLLTDRDGHVGHVHVVPSAPKLASVDLVSAGDVRGKSGQASHMAAEDLARLESAAKDLRDVDSARRAHEQVKNGLEKPAPVVVDADDKSQSATAAATPVVGKPAVDNDVKPMPSPPMPVPAVAVAQQPPVKRDAPPTTVTTVSTSASTPHSDTVASAPPAGAVPPAVVSAPPPVSPSQPVSSPRPPAPAPASTTAAPVSVSVDPAKPKASLKDALGNGQGQNQP